MVVQVIAVVDVGHIDVIVVVPIVAPVFRPGVNFAEPITLILEARESANHQEGEAGDAKAVILAKVSTESVLRNAIAMVSATLLPGAVVGLPMLRTVLVPRRVLDALLFGGASCWFMATLLGVL